MKQPPALLPNDPGPLIDAARAARHAGRSDKAERLYVRILARWPDHMPARSNLAQLLLERGEVAAARRQSRAALAVDPTAFAAYLNTGADPDEARRAVRLRPDDPRGWNNLGNALRLTGRAETAGGMLERAVTLAPGDGLIWNNLALARLEAGLDAPAGAAFGRALSVLPGFAPALFNSGALDLAAGRWAAGWAGYRLRYAAGHATPRPFRQPSWSGGAPPSSLLVWGDQGVGDEVMFASALPDLPPPPGGAVLETDARLVPLFARSFPQWRVVARATPPDAATATPAAQVALPELAGMLRSDGGRFPARAGYLRPDAPRAAGMRAALKVAAGGKPIVGLAWRGGASGRLRSIPPGLLAPLLDGAGAWFLSLQARETEEERALCPADRLTRPAGLDLWEELDGLAALVAALDLVVTVDTLVAHLAGALGVPVWVMLPAAPDWRWRRAGSRSLWYPTARLFRQDADAGWAPVVEAVRAALGTREWA